MADKRPWKIRLLDASALYGWFLAAGSAMVPALSTSALIVVGLVSAGCVAVSLERLSIYRDQRDRFERHLVEAERERDSYADALASVLDQACRGDVEGVVAHAKHALETGDYHGRLRATQDALEAATAREEADLLACSCADEMGQR